MDSLIFKNCFVVSSGGRRGLVIFGKGRGDYIIFNERGKDICYIYKLIIFKKIILKG